MNIKSGIHCKDNEENVARFLHGVDHDISDIVELHHYVQVDDVVHKAIKGEKNQKKWLRKEKHYHSQKFGRINQRMNVFHCLRKPQMKTKVNILFILQVFQLKKC